MTDMNIPKYILFANEKKVDGRPPSFFTLETAFHWECWGAVRDTLLTVYTVSYYKPIRKQEIYLQYYNNQHINHITF